MDNLTIRAMVRAELDVAIGWAAVEGWNPGLHDADAFWATDPDGFVALEHEGQMVGSGSIISYSGQFGFMGFFIVRPDLRGQGWGGHLWHERVRRLKNRLQPGASIGMDGVFTMQAYYGKGGFKFAWRDIRFQGQGREGTLPAGIVAADQVDFDSLVAFDGEHFPCARPQFLKHWLKLPQSGAFAYCPTGGLEGYAVVRRAKVGWRIGPLFARHPEAAEALFQACSQQAAGDEIFLDAPENNPAATQLVRRHGMNEVFGCARMYLGGTPKTQESGVFGVTTLELG